MVLGWNKGVKSPLLGVLSYVLCLSLILCSQRVEVRASSFKAHCVRALGWVYLGQFNDHHVFYEPNGGRGRLHLTKNIQSNVFQSVSPIPLRVPKQMGPTCQSHAVMNILRAMDILGHDYDRSIIGDVHGNYEGILEEFIEHLFENQTGDSDDDLRHDWDLILRKKLRRAGIYMSNPLNFKRPKLLDDLYDAVQEGNGVFLNYSFKRARRVLNHLDQGRSVRFYSPDYLEQYAHGSAHAVAVVGAFEVGHKRYILVLDSNTGSFAVWSIEELKALLKGPYDSRSLIYFFVMSTD